MTLGAIKAMCPMRVRKLVLSCPIDERSKSIGAAVIGFPGPLASILPGTYKTFIVKHDLVPFAY